MFVHMASVILAPLPKNNNKNNNKTKKQKQKQTKTKKLNSPVSKTKPNQKKEEDWSPASISVRWRAFF